MAKIEEYIYNFYYYIWKFLTFGYLSEIFLIILIIFLIFSFAFLIIAFWTYFIMIKDKYNQFKYLILEHVKSHLSFIKFYILEFKNTSILSKTIIVGLLCFFVGTITGFIYIILSFINI